MKRYSEAFKHQVVSEYEGGQSVLSLRKKYGITGNGTVERWVRKFGHTGFRAELVVIQRAEERRRLRAGIVGAIHTIIRGQSSAIVAFQVPCQD